MNTYELAASLQTTGWNSQQDVNGKNSYGMTPAQVAAQAGDVEEFRAITTDAKFDPEKMGVVHTFFQICRTSSESHYKAIIEYFQQVFLEQFKFDPDRKVFTRHA